MKPAVRKVWTMFEPTEEQRRLIEIKKEIREEMRRQKAEDARRELWDGFDADALLTDALEAQRRAREAKFSRELREQIHQELAVSVEGDVPLKKTCD